MCERENSTDKRCSDVFEDYLGLFESRDVLGGGWGVGGGLEMMGWEGRRFCLSVGYVSAHSLTDSLVHLLTLVTHSLTHSFAH